MPKKLILQLKRAALHSEYCYSTELGPFSEIIPLSRLDFLTKRNVHRNCFCSRMYVANVIKPLTTSTISIKISTSFVLMPQKIVDTKQLSRYSNDAKGWRPKKWGATFCRGRTFFFSPSYPDLTWAQLSFYPEDNGGRGAAGAWSSLLTSSSTEVNIGWDLTSNPHMLTWTSD